MNDSLEEDLFFGNCSTIQEISYEDVDLVWIRVLFAIFYSVLWVTAVVGNSLVLYVVVLNQVSLSVRSVFIGCLAVSDLLMALTSLPVTAVTIFTRNWIFPSFFCKLIGVFQVMSFNRAALTVLGIWILGYSLALPVGIYSRDVAYPGICGTFCEEYWPDFTEDTQRSDSRRLYGLSVLLLQFAMPALISSFCYWMISRVISDQIERRRGHNLRTEAEEKLVNRKARANRMMLFMVFCFILCWSPINMLNLYRDFINIHTPKWFNITFAFSHAIAMASAVANPVIYSWFNPQFRSVIQYIFNRRNQMMKRMSFPNSTTYKTDPIFRPTDSKKRSELIVPEKIDDLCLPNEADELL
ncbi:hypothetical protein WR25_22107 [Diploscapter pachys]|uniref:G-protein coupled receptors family 1 profile domain-containing protein n=1 Tax=Diploscapter pachys TaxID=2018661 RepID=A0A2A2JGL7_9BILA|nr:hypothetical protein WR25_22107 [Diploscapter pachys]